ncbi:MAG: DUF2269 domain-containing protein [Oceanospirillales bacterium]|nr:DUF2269 domain-containing protein [Oceanospirillales bacterium]
MSIYLILKWAHILSAFLLFGTGLGSAFYKFMSYRGGQVPAIAETDRLVVLADWLFTTPTILVQPLTGVAMLWLVGLPLTTPWVLLTFALYLLAGICWLPVVWLQLRMKALSRQAVVEGTPLPAIYHHYSSYWLWLGVPAFAAMMGVVGLMVFKPYF